jgi:hypothetical protein
LYLGNNETMVRDPRGGHNRKKINEDFFKTWSPQMTYVLGFMYADGALLNTKQTHLVEPTIYFFQIMTWIF